MAGVVRRRLWLLSFAVFLLVPVLAGCGGTSHSGASHSIVPNVISMSQAGAIAKVESVGLKAQVVRKQSKSVAVGKVFTETPASGASVGKGSVVTLWVASRSHG